MAKPGGSKGIAEYKERLNSDYKAGDRVNVTLYNKKVYSGTVEGHWSNFGLNILFDGSTKSTIVNLLNEKVELIS